MINLYVYHVVRVDEERGEDNTVLDVAYTHIAGPFGWYGDAHERKEKETLEGFGSMFEIVTQKMEVIIT